MAAAVASGLPRIGGELEAGRLECTVVDAAGDATQRGDVGPLDPRRDIRPSSGTPPTNASRRPARSAGAYRANCRPISRPRASMARAMRPVACGSPSARRSSSNTCQYISARFLNAAYSSPRRRSASAISGPLDHVDVRQHVEIDVALDHGLAALVLLETPHRRFGR